MLYRNLVSDHFADVGKMIGIGFLRTMPIFLLEPVLVTNCHGLKMASADFKNRPNRGTICPPLRLIDYIGARQFY
jgi:hypothetical protein